MQLDTGANSPRDSNRRKRRNERESDDEVCLDIFFHFVPLPFSAPAPAFILSGLGSWFLISYVLCFLALSLFCCVDYRPGRLRLLTQYFLSSFQWFCAHLPYHVTRGFPFSTDN